ncbi:hypothetical protein N7532_002259 [Penicillium argentinense]|uniref:Arrestin-like N-terminal domain-containing protein n=1 Tax=Penicillium argentinense TaxID=1131581 RepID=A0A9W9G011_9EURO|nr:uncharacterized protein N7532_002259 [Penicillium argentinense]KAJ5109614.1 hypothetical protein N7532_002259 [Penicillium argentinense]
MFSRNAEAYDLRLDQACVFIQDDSTCVKGKFHIYLPRSASLKDIRVKLIGSMNLPRDDSLFEKTREILTLLSDHALGSSKTLNSFQLSAGNYEFPFSIPLPSAMTDTVTGPKHMYQMYYVQATIERRFRYNTVVSQPIRIYHPPVLGQLMPSDPMTLEGQTKTDIQYCISMPDLNVPFASSFTVNCWIAPLSKNLKLRNVSLAVIEKHYLRVTATAAESVMHNVMTRNWTRTSTIFSAEQKFSGVTGSPDDLSPEWSLDLPVHLPDSFDLASQSVSTSSINIIHEVVVQAEFENTEIHAVVKMDAKIPFSIYMTPAVIGEDATIHNQSIECFSNIGETPPPYGDHKADAILLAWEGNLRRLGLETSPSFSDQCCQLELANASSQYIGSSASIEPPAYGSYPTA